MQVGRLNVQRQDKFRWKPSFAVVRSFLDQLVRADDIDRWTLRRVEFAIDLAERFADRGQVSVGGGPAGHRRAEARGARQYEDLRDALDDLADSFKRKSHNGRGHGRWGR